MTYSSTEHAVYPACIENCEL